MGSVVTSIRLELCCVPSGVGVLVFSLPLSLLLFIYFESFCGMSMHNKVREKGLLFSELVLTSEDRATTLVCCGLASQTPMDYYFSTVILFVSLVLTCQSLLGFSADKERNSCLFWYILSICDWLF